MVLICIDENAYIVNVLILRHTHSTYTMAINASNKVSDIRHSIRAKIEKTSNVRGGR